MKLNHFSHPHPLVLVEEQEMDWISIIYNCSACQERVEGSSYNCSECDFCLHKSCAELPREINHPSHLYHPLILYEKRPMDCSYSVWFCNSCRKVNESGEELFVYHCSSCDFDLDIRCALLINLISGDIPKLKHFSHQHSLFFLKKHYIEPQDQSCSACEEPISGPVYCCFDCSFFLHQKCFELPLEINHPSHRKHSVTLLPNPPPHLEKCSCHLCTKAFKGFIYYCSLCEFGIKIKYTFSDKVIKSENHEHPFILVSRPFSFFCDACGTDGEYCIPFVCTECDIAVHKDCISLPQKIKITRHEHPLSHIYFLEEYEGKNKVCKICWDEINMEYGSYRCLQCDYFVHVNCATEKMWWEKEYDESQKSNEALEMLSDEWASISCVLKKEHRGEEVIATEIQHFSHQHNLILSVGSATSGMNMLASCASDALKYLTTSLIQDTGTLFSLTTSIKGNEVAVKLEMVLLDARIVTLPCVLDVLCCRLQPGTSLMNILLHSLIMMIMLWINVFVRYVRNQETQIIGFITVKFASILCIALVFWGDPHMSSSD
ncbi:hypothetical protein SLEP1_g42948 [Rubroshorea leprosula]|uniref:Phorbol-ester/DAG-type domain-containing protein n=1 Tax=Rubroshorea leprosula TaxID=152421 RepID=A0AAV5LBG8_9ROSI|nr:hypothetical protein SLEP1_g42948 [Rubroshorea leprosula]